MCVWDYFFSENVCVGLFFLRKMSVWDYFFSENVCFMLIGSWKGGKNSRVGIFMSNNLLESGDSKHTTFLGRTVRLNSKDVQSLIYEAIPGIPNSQHF